MKSPAFVGIDLGTTAAKAIAIAIDGTILGESSVGYPTRRTVDGIAEQRTSDWLDAIETAIGNVVTSDVEPVSVGLCSQVNTHVLVDKYRNPVAPAITWQDQRCAPIARRLTDELGHERIEQIWGGPFSIDSSFSLCRYEWFRQHEPALLEHASHLLSPKDFCVAALVGTVATDPLTPVGLVNIDGTYNEAVLALSDGFSARQAPILPFDALAGTSTGTLGLPSGLPVAVGTMDAWGGIFGSGAVHPGMSFEISGTSEIVGTVSSTPGSAEGVISFPPVKNRYVHAGPTQAGGDALRWVAKLLSMSATEALQVAGEHTSASAPLLFLPHLAGERAPVWNADARGVWFGLTIQTDATQLIHSVLEGVAFSARRVMECCRHATAETVDAVRLSGGATESQLWNQVKSDVHDLSAEIVSSPSTGAIGAALMGAAAHGDHGSLDELADRIVGVSSSLRPSSANRARLDDLYGQYCELYASLVEPFARLCATPQ